MMMRFFAGSAAQEQEALEAEEEEAEYGAANDNEIPDTLPLAA